MNATPRRLCFLLRRSRAVSWETRLLLLVGVQLGGVALLQLPARTWAIGLVDCANWPPPGEGALPELAFLVGVALLTVGWLGLVRAGEARLPTVMALALAVHACALLIPPFLSQDPLFYAAIGRAIARYHQDPYRVAIGLALPDGDPYRAALPGFWRGGTSAYSPGFHLVARAVVGLAGESLARALMGFQAVGALAMLLTAWLSGVAARSSRAAALVAFSPLAIVEGTISAHNDGLVAVCVALFAVAVTRRRPLAGLGALALALSVKASALLLVGFDALALAFAWVRAHCRRARAGYLAIAALAAAALAAAIPVLRHVTQRLGAPHGESDFCTSFTVECALRYGVRLGLHAGVAAWAIGVAFRLAGAAVVAWMALRASRDGQPLSWAATVLFAYFLYFSGQSHAWYWLPMLPLCAFADARVLPAMLCVTATSLFSYVVHLRMSCAEVQQLPMWQRVAGNAVEEVLLNVPTTILLLRGLSARRRTAPTAR